MKYAVIKTGGKQYLVTPGQKLKVEKVNVPEGGPAHRSPASPAGGLGEGGKIIFDEILLLADDKKVELGTPNVKGAKVEAKVLKQGRGKKVLVFRYHSKTRYRKKKGHRQPFTEIEIQKI